MDMTLQQIMAAAAARQIAEAEAFVKIANKDEIWDYAHINAGKMEMLAAAALAIAQAKDVPLTLPEA